MKLSWKILRSSRHVRGKTTKCTSAEISIEGKHLFLVSEIKFLLFEGHSAMESYRETLDKEALSKNMVYK